MDKTKKTEVDNHDKALIKREPFLTRFVVCHAPVMRREDLIKYYMKIQEIYKKLGNTKKIFDFQKLINETKDSNKYLDMIEAEYEAQCEHFDRDENAIKTIHENLINVCEELGLSDKAAYYKGRLSEWQKH